MVVSLIVATGQNGVIGSGGKIPWRLPADMAFFKRTTMGKPIIMGRKTWESLTKALPGRHNIVVTRNPDFQAQGATVVTSLADALEVTAGAEEVVVIGGAQLYAAAMPLVQKAYMTEIHHEFEGDTWFPPMDKTEWQLEQETTFPADHKNPYAFTIRVFSLNSVTR